MKDMSLKLKIILGVLFFIAGFVVIRIGMVFSKNMQLAANISRTMTTPAPTQNPSTVDSDRDGLSDRDEIIYGTDPFNKDTDGDGFMDGEEVAAGTDPLDPSSTPKNGRTISLISHSANLTDRLLNMGVASLVNDSGQLDSNSLTSKKYADIMQDITNAAAVSLAVVTPTDNDIAITDDNSQAAVQKYLKTLSSLIEEGLFSTSSNITSGIGESGVSDKYPSYYENVYNSLKVIPVPSSWKELHKTTLTTFLQLSTSFKAMTTLEDDPIRASFSLNQIQQSFLHLVDLINQATQLAKSQNVPIDDSILNMMQTANSSLPSAR